MVLPNFNPYIVHCGYLNKSNCPPAGTIYEERQVRWNEIELVLWGEGYVITEGVKLPAKGGTLFFRSPGMIVQGVSPYYCYAIIFDSNYDPARLNEYKDNRYYEYRYKGTRIADPASGLFSSFGFPHHMLLDRIDPYRQYFTEIYGDYLHNSQSNQLFLKTRLFEILLAAYSDNTRQSLANSPRRSVRNNYHQVMKSKSIIDQNPQKNYKLSELSDAAALSPNFFCKIFREITGSSPITYINLVKINTAKRLLAETNLLMKEIADRCGFENETYFYTLFKKFTTLSPSEYRDRNRILW